jgi:hypothetical protein
MREFAKVLRQITETQQEIAAHSRARSRAETVTLTRR